MNVLANMQVHPYIPKSYLLQDTIFVERHKKKSHGYISIMSHDKFTIQNIPKALDFRVIDKTSWEFHNITSITR